MGVPLQGSGQGLTASHPTMPDRAAGGDLSSSSPRHLPGERAGLRSEARTCGPMGVRSSEEDMHWLCRAQAVSGSCSSGQALQ